MSIDMFSSPGPEEVIPRSYAGVYGEISGGEADSESLMDPDAHIAKTLGEQLPEILKRDVFREISMLKDSPDTNQEVVSGLGNIEDQLKRVGRLVVADYIKRHRP